MSKQESPEERAQAIHEEARMVLPGIQTLFGFQLIAAFNARFSELEMPDRIIHLCALVLVALAIALIMTPAAYHRICEQDRTTSYFADLASTLIAAAMVPLLLGITLDIFVVTHITLDGRHTWSAVILAACAFAVFVALWIAFPYWRRLRPRRRGHGDFLSAQGLLTRGPKRRELAR